VSDKRPSDLHPYELLLADRELSGPNADAGHHPTGEPGTVAYDGPDVAGDPVGQPTRLTGGAADPASRTPMPIAISPSAGIGRDALNFLGPPQAVGELGRFGPYPVLRVLGQGGMGVVFLAEDPRLGRRMALKVMRPALAANAPARQRFLREARAVAAMAHDNVVPVFHAGEEGSLPYLLMPLLQGETLESHLQRAGRLPPDAVARIGGEIAEGLHHAHERGLVHRDVKPGNVWIEQGTGRVKVLDFGLVRVADSADALTRPGALLGTPSFMAPEQIEPARSTEIDHRCDLFALGCVLYLACTGSTPFQGAGVHATFWAVLNHEPPPPCSLRPDVPQALSDLILVLLSKDPRKRPTSAAAVVSALRATVDTASPKPAARRSRRRWWPVLGVLLLAVAATAFWQGGRPAAEGRRSLVVKTSDGCNAVTFRGEWTRVVDPCTERVFELRASEGEIEVKELPNGAHFFTKQFVLRQDGKVVVDVQFETAGGKP
jgi:hypothetical protein